MFASSAIMLGMATFGPCGDFNRPVGDAEKKIVAEIVLGRVHERRLEEVVRLGPRISPVLMQILASEGTTDSQRAKVFSIVRNFRVATTGDFVAVAANFLPTCIVSQSGASLALIEEWKDCDFAPVVCNYLFRVVRDRDPEDDLYTERIVRCLAAIGTKVELARLESWLDDSPPLDLKGVAGERYEQSRKTVIRAVKLLKAKGKS